MARRSVVLVVLGRTKHYIWGISYQLSTLMSRRGVLVVVFGSLTAEGALHRDRGDGMSQREDPDGALSSKIPRNYRTAELWR
jgi:hypothetical protein